MAFSKRKLTRIDDVLAGYVERGDLPGAVWCASRGDEVHVGAVGDGYRRDRIFRLSSMSKPITAAAALVLVEECLLRLDDPVDGWLPELADRQVLRRIDGPLDDTVPAHRPITVRDVLTFRLGLGMDFANLGRQSTMARIAELGLAAAPPAPAIPPEPDEWLRRLGQVPLDHQPGERWLYDIGSDVLGVLVARAAGAPLDAVLRTRVLDPLGMVDTGFSVLPASLDRFGPCLAGDGSVYDAPDGQWSSPPAFPSGAAGLVGTVDDYLAFARMLAAGGGDVLARPTVEAMTTDHLEGLPGPDPTGTVGWGFGVGVVRRRTGTTHCAGSYGWSGGLGTDWANDPAEDLVGILLTDRMWSSPGFPPAFQDFWTSVYAALDN